MGSRRPRTPAATNCSTEDTEEMETLRRELYHEKRLRDTILWSNEELERTIQELEEDLESITSPRNIDGGELQMRLEAQLAVNEHLENTKQWLEMELEQTKQQAKAGSLPEAMNLNLDSLTDTELIRLVKHLERNRTDLYSTLRDNEWKLDKEGKEYYRLSEIRGMYQAELRHYTRTLERLRIQQLHESGAQVMTSVEHSPGPSSISRWGGGNGIKTNQRILDARKGPIKRTVGVRPLPKVTLPDCGEKKGKGVRKRKGTTKAGTKTPTVTVTAESSVEIPSTLPAVTLEATIDSGLPSTDQTSDDTPDKQTVKQDSKEDTEDKDTEE